MKKTIKKEKMSWKIRFLNILKPNIVKILFTIILLIILPVYPCKIGVICESKGSADCTQLKMNFFTLLEVKEMQNPLCIYSLLYFPVILALVYILVSIIVFVIRKKNCIIPKLIDTSTVYR